MHLSAAAAISWGYERDAEVVPERCFGCRVGVPGPVSDPQRADAPQREHSLRAVFNAVRYAVKTGCQWDFLPHDFPPASAVYQQARRWVVERTFAWLGRFRRLAWDYERLSEVLAGWHWLAFLTVLLPRLGLQSA